VIRVSKIMKAVYDEILGDINNAVTLHADETGWRVRGKNWWLWVFGTQDSAYFTVDKSRGSSVVRRVLGEIFLGLLVVDGWNAYLQVICEQQSCMAHLLRKIRKFRDAFPRLSSIVKFYVKLRRILRDGERLQADREKLGEKVFQRRLKRLGKKIRRPLELAKSERYFTGDHKKSEKAATEDTDVRRASRCALSQQLWRVPDSNRGAQT